jgi:ribosomal RNA-processing protein 8
MRKKRTSWAERFNSGKFRYLNEILYTSNSSAAASLLSDDPELFADYHQGFAQQVSLWPENPIDSVLKRVYELARETKTRVADLGCGEGKIGLELANDPNFKVHSFDLVSVKPHIQVADIANVPLRDKAVHIAILCLALMGTNHVDFVSEAHRILKPRGTLLVAEVTSRIGDEEAFLQGMRHLGFRSISSWSNGYFNLYEFQKTKAKLGSAPDVLLTACTYKKR